MAIGCRSPAARAGAAFGVTSSNLTLYAKRQAASTVWRLCRSLARSGPVRMPCVAGPVMWRERNKTAYSFCCVRLETYMGALPPTANRPALF